MRGIRGASSGGSLNGRRQATCNGEKLNSSSSSRLFFLFFSFGMQRGSSDRRKSFLGLVVGDLWGAL